MYDKVVKLCSKPKSMPELPPKENQELNQLIETGKFSNKSQAVRSALESF